MDSAQKPISVSDSHLAAIIAVRCYGARPRVEPLSRFKNSVFRLRFADGSKILKLAGDPAKGGVRKELMLIELVGRHGIPAPVIEHEDADGRLVGIPFFIMDSAGDQTAADWIGRPGDDPRRLFAEMGSVLARIHGIAFERSGDIRHDGIVPSDPRELLDELYRLTDWLVEERLLECDEAALFKSLPMPQTDGVQLCHSDFHAVQCIVHDGRIAAVVDWESAWAGNPAVDFAITHAYLDFYCPPELIRHFVAGYTAIRALPEDYRGAYLPVRMATSLGLLRAWQGRGRRAWQYAVEQQKVGRAIELYRAYWRQWRG